MDTLHSKLERFAEGELTLSFEESQELIRKCRQQRSMERAKSKTQIEARLKRIDQILEELSHA